MPGMSFDEAFQRDQGISYADAFRPPEPKIKRIKSTPLESGFRGAAQGASFGFADELAGALGSAYNVATGPKKIRDLVDEYKRVRDEYRQADALSKKDNPGSFTTGEVGAALGTAFIPGIGFLNAAKGAKLGQAVAKGAASGALAGYGGSREETLSGDVKRATEGALIGGALPVGLAGAGKVAKAVVPRNVVKKSANVLLNTPEELTELMLDRGKEKILQAPRRYEVARRYQDILDRLKKETIEGSKDARKELANIKFKAKDIGGKAGGIAGAAERKMAGIMDDPEKAAGINLLRNIEDQYKQRGGKISGSRVKDTIQSLDKQTQFEVAPGKFASADNALKKKLRRALDQELKKVSPRYKESMKGVAKDAALLDRANKLGSDKTLANVMRRIETDEFGAGVFPREIIEQVDARMGSDILDQAKLAYAREAFDKSITQGSMNVNKFRNMLEGIPIIGRFAGVLGASVDKYGRKMTMAAIDGTQYLESAYKKSGLKAYNDAAEPLRNLARQGNKSAALSLFMMEENYPELKTKIDRGE